MRFQYFENEDNYPERYNLTSVLSGIMIGIGVIANSVISNKYVGAMLFSLALLTIIKCNFQLYTGRIGYAIYKRHSFHDYFVMFVGNYFGTGIVAIWYFLQDQKTKEAMQVIAFTKFSKSYMLMFISGILCGVLMMIAVYCKETIITVFCIMTFILCGFEHCIADVPYFLISAVIPYEELLIKLGLVILGNSIGAILINLLIRFGKNTD